MNNNTRVFTKIIPEATTNYINLLDYNVSSRKKLALDAAERFGVNDATTKAFKDEYFIYDMKYTLVRNNLTNAVIPVELHPFTTWNLDYPSSTMTITIVENVVSTELIEKYKDCFSKELVNIIDENTNANLVKLYSQEFDDELGLVNDTCSCGGDCKCNK